MKIDTRVKSRMNDLFNQGQSVVREHGKSTQSGEYWSDGGAAYSKFYTSTMSLLTQVFGESSVYANRLGSANSGLSSQCKHRALQVIGVLEAAKDDYENGYLFNTKTLIEAEVFSDFLEQAEELFNKGYFQPAAVVTGCVLEDALRKMCAKNGVAVAAKPKLDAMNTDLVKASVYSGLVQKQVTAWADLRNKAAHGEWDKFTKEDVKNMMAGVQTFMAQHYI